MKIIQRLFYRKSYLEKTVNLDFTETGVVWSVGFGYYDTKNNLKVLKKCLKLYKYDRLTIENYISKLETSLKKTIKWKEDLDKRKRYLSQGGLGNWYGKKCTLEDMIKELKSKN